ncbi:MAG: GAF domain-containing protein [Bacteroidota bacterium]
MANKKTIFDSASPEGLGLTAEEMRTRLLDAQGFSTRVSTLTEIALEIDAARSREDILKVLRNQSKWLVEYDCSIIALLNRPQSHYIVNSLSTLTDSLDISHKDFSIDEGMLGWVIKHQSPIIVDLESAPSFHQQLEGKWQQAGMRTLLIVPLRTGSDILGSLCFGSSKQGAYADQDLWIAHLLSLEVAIALKNSTLFEDAKKRLNQIELVNEVASKLNRTLELEELLNSAAEAVQKTFNYFDVTIFLVNSEQDELTLVAHSGSYIDFLPHGYKQKLSQGVVGWVVTRGEKLLINDVSLDPRYLAYIYHNTNSELAVPIKVDGDVVGVLNVEDTKLHAFDETDATVLETLCEQIGVAIKRARLYDELKRANMKLTELDKMKSEFLGIVSHDFRSPLSSIVLAAKSLLRNKDGGRNERVNEYLSIIMEQANRLAQLAEDTLSITRMEAGRLSYHFNIVNVERLIQDAIAMVRFSSLHTLALNVDSKVSYIKGDQTKLRQVIQNLVSNAVKYSPKGGTVSITVAESSSDEIMVTVSDDGMGIPSEQLDRLFHKFSRVDMAGAREIKGSGLGLWICKEVVGAHGGRIWVESELGKGSTFKFSLKKAQQ